MSRKFPPEGRFAGNAELGRGGLGGYKVWGWESSVVSQLFLFLSILLLKKNWKC